MKVIHTIFIIILSLLPSISYAYELNIESLDKSRLAKYLISYQDSTTNIPIDQETSALAKKQLQALGFSKIINAKDMNETSCPEYFESLKKADKLNAEMDYYKNQPYAKKYTLSETMCVMAYLWVNLFPDSNARDIVNKLGLYYTPKTGLAEYCRTTINNNPSDISTLGNIIYSEIAVQQNIVNTYENPYNVIILLERKSAQGLKSEFDMYNDINRQIQQGYTTYEQSSIYYSTSGFYITVRFYDPKSTSRIVPVAIYGTVIENDSLWMPVCKKYHNILEQKEQQRQQQQRETEKRYKI